MGNQARPDQFIESADETIVSTPGVCGGKPRIAGHRIRVQDIVLWKERSGMTPDQMSLEHPGLTLAEIAASLAYFEGHREEIEDAIKGEDEFADDLEQSLSSAFERLARKPDAQDHPNSSG